MFQNPPAKNKLLAEFLVGTVLLVCMLGQVAAVPATVPGSERTLLIDYRNCRIPKGNEIRIRKDFSYFPLPSAPDASVELQEVNVEGVRDLDQDTVQDISLQLFRVPIDQPFAIHFTIRTRVIDYRKAIEEATFPTQWPAEVRRFLGPSETRFYTHAKQLRINPSSAVVQAAARGLRRQTPIQTVREVLGWLKSNLRYNLAEHFTVDEVIHRGYGECGAYSATFVALVRACGIPARDVWGLTDLDDGKRTKSQLAGHMWAEVYFDGVGWVPVEPQRSETLGLLPANYVRFCEAPVKSSEFPWYSAPNESLLIMGGRNPDFKVVP